MSAQAVHDVGAATRAVVDPRTGAVIEEVGLLEPGSTRVVGERAARAFERWARTPVARRCELVAELATALAGATPEVAPAFSREHGKTVQEAELELGRAAETLRWFAQAGEQALAPGPLPSAAGLERRLAIDPAGPVLAIVPWNFPAVVLARKLGAALVAGCPVIVKGPEETPRVVRAFEAAAATVELPPDVVQVVFAEPAAVLELVRAPEVAHVTFTGSTRVGRIIAATAADTLTPCTLELGGHAPAIVMPGAELEVAATALARAKFGSTGQSCGAPSRFIAQEEVHDELLERLIALAPPLDRDADGPGAMGPLNNDRRRDAVHDLVVDAAERGALLRAGGALPDGAGSYYPATVLSDVPLDARVMAEEPFGPIAPFVRYGDEQEALAIANGTDYALSAYVFGPPDAAVELARAVDAGSVSVNAAPGAAPDAPLGGRHASGYGYEGGEQGLLTFVRLKILQAA